MAKSPIGGSRAYLKGRIGSDVYSLGKDGKGKRQQVVRALAEVVANPRTPDQMVNRMIMSTVMQAAKFYGAVIDHSFDALAKGQPSISEFIRRNYAILKAGTGLYNEYQQKGLKVNNYVLSEGKAIWPVECSFGQCMNDNSRAYGLFGVTITMKANTASVGDLRAILQVKSVDDYITIFGPVDGNLTQAFYRAKIKSSLTDDVLLNTLTGDQLFDIEGDANDVKIWTPDSSSSDDVVVFLGTKQSNMRNGNGAILSQKSDGKWIHTSCQLLINSDRESNFDIALATYPVGSEMFLNGGDL